MLLKLTQRQMRALDKRYKFGNAIIAQPCVHTAQGRGYMKVLFLDHAEAEIVGEATGRVKKMREGKR